MKLLFSLLLFFSGAMLFAQQPQRQPFKPTVANSAGIKDELVNLAIQNSGIESDEANIRIAEYEVKKTKLSWLDAINASANINEYVVRKSPVAIYYPKYNLGVAIPVGAFVKRGTDLKIAKELVTVKQVQKNEDLKAIKTSVLTRYEDYLAKKDNLQLQVETVQEILTSYLKAQKDYVGKDISLEALNSASVQYNGELAKQRNAERDLNIAYIELEELVGFRLKDVLTRYGILTN